MPSTETTADSLTDMRIAMSELRIPAPEGSRTRVEERLISRPDGSDLRVLVYRPLTPQATGALLWIHGGGMVMGAPEMNDAQSRMLAERAGCVVIAPNYRFAPEHPYPSGLEDCYTSLRWVRQHTEDLSIPSKRIAVAGESGGGGIAAGLALLARDRGEIELSAQFLQYPMLDDRTGTAAEPRPLPFAGEFVWTETSNRFAWSAVLGKDAGGSDTPPYAAPARGSRLAGLPPTYLMIGDIDLFVRENLRFAADLIRDGVPTELHIYPGAFHGFTTFSHDTDLAERARQEFWGAIKRHFNPSRHVK